MDGIRQPVGDEPAKVYWVRRLVVTLVLVGALAFTVWWLGSLFGDAAQSGPTPSGSPSPTVTPTVSEDPARACTGQDFSVVTTSPASFSGTSPAEFTVTVELTSGSPCSVDPTVDAKLVVKSGQETWFDSSTCEGYPVYGVEAERFILQETAPQELTATWNYGRGDAACSGEPKAKSGFYWVTATVQGVEAEPVQFEVK